MKSRRKFLKQSGALSATLLAARIPVLGNSLTSDSNKLNDPILEKKLDAAWVKSLYERGKVTTYLKSKNELQYIGMPVGGINSGMVYLGGDGRLWLWDVFNKNQTGVIYKNVKWHEKIQGNFDFLRPFDGANYVEPVKDVRPFEQGFAIRIEYDNKTIIKRLQSDDWAEIAFESTYPIGTIKYLDDTLPVNIQLQAFSPFIPLNEDDSGLPITILNFQVENKTSNPVKVTLTGWLENKSCIYTAIDEQYPRVNKATIKDDFAAILASTESFNWVDEAFKNAPDYGNFCLTSFNTNSLVNTSAALAMNDSFFNAENKNLSKKANSEKNIASVGNTITLKPNEKQELNYGISWYSPNLSFANLPNDKGRYYTNRFKSSQAVAEYVSKHLRDLMGQTKLWRDTWYNESTLPYWFLERTFINTSTLATTTCHRFKSGRFYAWEGVGSCAGTCNHVWQYAHAVARIFPNLERDTRERVDLGVGFYEDGHIGFRSEYDTQPAIDGQAGRVLGIYREHQMSVDDSFLRRNWPKTKKAIEYILKQDRNGDGMTDTQLENTLDAKWPGEIAWIVTLTLASIKASQIMAEEMNDTSFAEICKNYVEKGKANLEQHLYNGEYFIHRPDPAKGKTVLGSYNTCHIDQVYGQSWAFQVGIGRIIDQQKTLSALKALWKYNFTTDVGPYLQTHHGGRPYALPGEGGMIMNTNPKNDPLPYGVKDEDAWQATYFHECMSGFEHQVASHMMAEGMVEEALILTRAIHDRYHAFKRNPFNEVECSDHYARAMASYGTFITACGFEYHGPKGYIRFAPKLSPSEFKAPFTSAKGWGSYAQSIAKDNKQTHNLTLQYGSLDLQSIGLEKADNKKIKNLTVVLGNEKIPAQFKQDGKSILVQFDKKLNIDKNQILSISIA